MTIDPGRRLALLRAGVGLASVLAPHRTGRLFAMDMASNVGAPFFARLYGARQIFMAAPAFGSDPVDQRCAIRWGLAVDGADLVAAVAGGATGILPRRAVATSAALSVVCVAGGVLALRAPGRRSAVPGA